MNNDWYKTIKKPSWSPAEQVFGQVWSVLYIIIFAVNIYVLLLLTRGEIDWMTALPFWLNLGFNIIFTPIQFGLRNNFLALVDIVLILATIVWSMVSIWPVSSIASFAYAPYLIWVCIATMLQICITWMNRK